ncbi:DUF1826 domain-containing protein [uncultured Paracoccus sp.]|uniref:DUF1826 domain-containing protein n=1 Tax=uncultured Paracoccus sp. TaxID=189685 RepID=UPI0025D2B7E5|nr:DUF1826 domain-containing protein [uncultured Paracoccus sp.]
MTQTAPSQTRGPDIAEARGILESDSAAVLQRITQPGAAAVLWRRSLPDALAEWLNDIPAGQLPALRALVDCRAVEGCIHAACDLSGLPAGTMRDLLASDIGALALIFARIMRNPLMHIRLEAVTTDACRRFHIDRMSARLLCTYRGPGTQFGTGDADGQVLRTGEMRSADAAILRGSSWPGDEITRLLHRSPPIAGSGDVRLLLVLDPAEPPADRRRRLH